MELPALDDVVGEVMIVRVRGEGKVRETSAEVEHRGELDAEFARRVDGDAEAEGLADARGLDAGAYAAPESRVEQNYINRRVERVGRELLEVDDPRIRRQRHPHLLAHAAQGVHAEGRVFEVVVAHVFDGLAAPDGLLG